MTEPSGPLRTIFQRFIYESRNGLPIGRDGTVRVSYFIDLLSACHVEQYRQEIATFFSEWVGRTWSGDPISAVVGPKRGNTLFAKAVADRLALKSAFARDNILFGRWIEGDVRPEDKVLLVDDVASEGEMLIDAVESLRECGILVNRAFVLINRPEGDARKYLEGAGVEYSYAINLSDADLAGLLSQGRIPAHRPA